jgi:hypothetical protein
MRCLLVVLAVALACSTAHARPRRQYQQGQPVQNAVRAMTNTAQGVAEACARMGRLQHMGGYSGPEGLGMGPTPDAAYRNCCFANSGMRDADVGYAQTSSGQWVVCRRYAQ